MTPFSFYALVVVLSTAVVVDEQSDFAQVVLDLDGEVQDAVAVLAENHTTAEEYADATMPEAKENVVVLADLAENTPQPEHADATMPNVLAELAENHTTAEEPTNTPPVSKENEDLLAELAEYNISVEEYVAAMMAHIGECEPQHPACALARKQMPPSAAATTNTALAEVADNATTNDEAGDGWWWATTTTTTTQCCEARENIVVLAELAANVYGLHDGDVLELPADSWAAQLGYVVHRSWPQADFWPNIGNENERPRAAMAVYTREDQYGTFAVLAIKGTSIGSLTDLLHDIQSIVGGVYPQAAIAAAEEVLKYCRNLYGNNRVLVTGHSLGGYLGEVLSTTYDVPGTVFCAPGPDTLGWPQNIHNGNYKNGRFRNINAEHDPFGNINIAFWSHKQWSIFVDDLHVHGIADMIEILKTLDDITEMTNANVLDYTLAGWTGFWLNWDGS